MRDEVDKKSKLIFVFDNLYTMYKKNKTKKFEDLDLITFNFTFEHLDQFKARRKNGKKS